MNRAVLVDGIGTNNSQNSNNGESKSNISRHDHDEGDHNITLTTESIEAQLISYEDYEISSSEMDSAPTNPTEQELFNNIPEGTLLPVGDFPYIDTLSLSDLSGSLASLGDEIDQAFRDTFIGDDTVIDGESIEIVFGNELDSFISAGNGSNSNFNIEPLWKDSNQDDYPQQQRNIQTTTTTTARERTESVNSSLFSYKRPCHSIGDDEHIAKGPKVIFPPIKPDVNHVHDKKPMSGVGKYMTRPTKLRTHSVDSAGNAPFHRPSHSVGDYKPQDEQEKNKSVVSRPIRSNESSNVSMNNESKHSISTSSVTSFDDFVRDFEKTKDDEWEERGSVQTASKLSTQHVPTFDDDGISISYVDSSEGGLDGEYIPAIELFDAAVYYGLDRVASKDDNDNDIKNHSEEFDILDEASENFVTGGDENDVSDESVSFVSRSSEVAEDEYHHRIENIDRPISQDDQPSSDKCTNHPHPALEFPLLYVIVKHCPFLLERIRGPYICRWRLLEPLQKRVPFGRVLGMHRLYMTWGELLLLIPFIVTVIVCLVYSAFFPSVKVTGKIARAAIIACVIFSQKNSLVTLFLGMAFDRAIFYHKMAGITAILSGLLHAIAFFLDPIFRPQNQGMTITSFTGSKSNIFGSMLIALMLAIAVTSLSQVRRRLYELFYYLHILMTGGIVACYYFHCGKLLPILILSIWLGDVFTRSIIMARCLYPKTVNLRIISDTVIELSFPKTAAFSYNPGQYIYIAIPDVSLLQWHPISISSFPEQKHVTLYIRKVGNWTSDLFDLAKKKDKTSILVEGPYGNVGMNIINDERYKHFILISGGIGVTSAQSIAGQMLYETTDRGRKLNKLEFIWIERDPCQPHARRLGNLKKDENISSNHPGSLKQADENESNVRVTTVVFGENLSMNLAPTLLSLFLPGNTSDRELEKLYKSDSTAIDNDEDIFRRKESRTGLLSNIDGGLASSDHNVDEVEPTINNLLTPWQLEADNMADPWLDALDVQVYVTDESVNTSNLPFVRIGKPNIQQIFLKMRKEAIETGDDRVAVYVSAPRKLIDLCSKACCVYSDEKVQFDFYYERATI